MDYDRPLYRKSKGGLDSVHTKLASVIPTFVGILLASVLACNNAEPDPLLARAQVELDSHRALWEQTRSSAYTYEYKVHCECSDAFGQPVKVTVNNGEIESIVYAESGDMGKSGDPPVVSGSPRYHTIDGLFDVIQDAITNEVDKVSVSYDRKFGYPRKVEIDHMFNSTDDEYFVAAAHYKPR